jgi:PAS domain S-box-containing protein
VQALSITVRGVIEQAVQSTSEGITISDARHPEQPLIYANPAFYQVTGYTPEETIGFNCRFLQGPGTDRHAVQMIRDALANQQQCVVELVNYRKDGSPFWNRLSIVPIFDGDGILAHFVGIQSDLTAAKEAETARAQLAAMRATMRTVNDVVRNFMSNVEYFRMLSAEGMDSDPSVIAEYEAAVNTTLSTLTKLSSAQEYREHEVLRGMVGIDLDAITLPSKPEA